MSANDYLVALANELYISDENSNFLMEHTSVFLAFLQNIFDDEVSIKPFGSFMRATAISPDIVKPMDIDIMLLVSYEDFEKKFNDKNFLARKLSTYEQVSKVYTDHPSTVVTFSDIEFVNFDISVGVQSGELCIYSRNRSEFEKEHSLEMATINKFFGISGVSSPDNTAVIETTAPWHLDNVIKEHFMPLFGKDLICLILVLKYWNKIRNTDIPSFIVEIDILHGLSYIKGYTSLFELLCFLILEDYDASTIMKKNYQFDKLKADVLQAKALEHAGDFTVSEKLIERNFPLP